MKALLLAAGTGQRLLPLTEKLPKCLMPILGILLIEYWLKSLSKAGIESVLINTHHHANLINNYLSSNKREEEIHLTYESTLLNTGGTLLFNRKYFENSSLMLIHADNLCLCDLSDFIQAHKNRPDEAEITMMTYNTTSPESCGSRSFDFTQL